VCCASSSAAALTVLVLLLMVVVMMARNAAQTLVKCKNLLHGVARESHKTRAFANNFMPLQQNLVSLSLSIGCSCVQPCFSGVQLLLRCAAMLLRCAAAHVCS